MSDRRPEIARNIASTMQVGWYRAVHLKRPEASKFRMLLSSREMLVRMRIDLDNMSPWGRSST